MDIKQDNDIILDVGCYDGYFLSECCSKLKIGIDLDPLRSNSVDMIAADAMYLPFKIKFDNIFAFDVIEHIKEDKKFLLCLIDCLSMNGELTLSTPSKDFRIFPHFLTSWLSKRWGHIKIGYSQSDIENMLTDRKVRINIKYWNAPFWRFFYFPLWISWKFFPDLTRIILKIIVRLDHHCSNGYEGYMFIIIEVL